MDIRKELIGNVHVVGGTAMIHGFKQAFYHDLHSTLAQDKVLSHLHNDIKFVDSSFKENVAAWVGASVFGTLKGVSSSSQIHRSEWHAVKTI